ncbi:MAG: decaprenyl-phosphate phosphoribosyltransferase [Chloroflexi bacterium]|nr:decaprenyl-phosphate phosphoribosyltransferase [Chloroflexota bacterium]
MEHSGSTSVVAGLAGIARSVVVTARPRQWTKNLIIYLAFLFTVNEAWSTLEPAATLGLLVKTTVAFVIFTALTSAVYLVNDIVDVDVDRRHPKKRLRPIASGRLPAQVAAGVAAILLTAGIGVAFFFETLFGAVSFLYVASMIAYSLALKNIVLLDVFIIGAGFVMRAVAGAVVINVPISPWLYICTGLGALFLALTKRRAELAVAGDAAYTQRKSLNQYTVGLLDQLIVVVATSAVIAYSLYTFTAQNLPENHAMMITIPLVIFGLFRYLLLMHTKGLGEEPEEVIIKDTPLIVVVLMWLGSSAAILTMFRG